MTVASRGPVEVVAAGVHRPPDTVLVRCLGSESEPLSGLHGLVGHGAGTHTGCQSAEIGRNHDTTLRD